MTDVQRTIATTTSVALGTLGFIVGVAKYLNYQARPPKPERHAYRLPSLPK